MVRGWLVRGSEIVFQTPSQTSADMLGDFFAAIRQVKPIPAEADTRRPPTFSAMISRTTNQSRTDIYAHANTHRDEGASHSSGRTSTRRATTARDEECQRHRCCACRFIVSFPDDDQTDACRGSIKGSQYAYIKRQSRHAEGVVEYGR